MRGIPGALALGLILAVVHAGPAGARDPLQVEQCADWKGEHFSIAERIDGCTATIRSGRYSGKNLVWAYVNRGIGYRDKKDYDHAIDDFDQAAKLDPDHANTFYNRGYIYDLRDDYAPAIADYSRAIRLNPDNSDYYFNRGLIYQRQHDYDRAVADFSRTIRINPRDAEAYYNRGRARRQLGDTAGADDDTAKAKEIKPNIGE